MAKIFRCMDCLKEFYFDFKEARIPGFDLENVFTESNQKLFEKYNKDINFWMEINICKDCLDHLQSNKNSVLDNLREDKDNTETICENRINELKSKINQNDEEIKKYDENLEKETLEKLTNLKKEVSENENKLQNLFSELKNVENQETDFWSYYKDLEKKIYDVNKNLSKSNDINLDYQNKIKSFAHSNIFSDLFQISFNEKYGIINECVFDDPSNSAHYFLINSGWGYIVLLTKLISIKYDFTPKNFEIIPLGNYSQVYDIENKKSHELTVNDDNFSRGSFNIAMVCYLGYLNELINYLKKNQLIEIKNEAYCPVIENDTINKFSIKFNGDRPENWYQCMKNLLTILKFLVSQILIQENKSYESTIDTINLSVK